jgi:hypothetical protein
MSKFIAGADLMATRAQQALQRGENGTMQYTDEGVGDHLVALFNALVRDMQVHHLQSLIAACYDDAEYHCSWPLPIRVEILVDLIILTFQTRNCRGGKGEKMLFYQMFVSLYNVYPATAIELVPLIAHYGYYKDYWNLLEYMNNRKGENEVKDDQLERTIIKFLDNQLRADHQKLLKAGDEKKTISLCAKYAPREHSHFSSGANKILFESLLAELFPSLEITQRKVAYRKMISALCKHLDTTERYMCAHLYSMIDFQKVASVCNLKFRKAFLNEVVSPKKRKHNRISSTTFANDTTGDRYPLDVDRVACRINFRATIKSQTIKGGQVYPHDLVKLLLKNKDKNSASELDLYDAQYLQIRETVINRLAAASATAEATSISSASSIRLDRFIPLVDVSGSMEGTPMYVAIALGILVSELTHKDFRHRIITFETTPRWIQLSPEHSFHEKVQALSRAPWGVSTNIERAFELIAQVVLEYRIPQEEVPDLIIFSDMQFDQTSPGDKNTQLQRIQKRFHDLGMQISGTPYTAPRIVFWNLRDAGGHVATATTENVQMLSGFSPAMLDLVMGGEEIVEAAADGSQEAVKAKVTPYDTFRRAVDHKDYDLVREVLSKSSESLLEHYHFEPSAIQS